RVDPFPAFIDVVLGGSTPPATPGNLAARVDGSAVTLTWDAATASDLTGYRVYRDDSLLRELGTETATTDSSRPDGVYQYQVSAFDDDGNESAKSEAADASIYAPSLQPAFPIFEGATLELPGEGSAPGAKVALFREGSPTVLVETTADGEGRFLFSPLALPLGESPLEARATDAEGNRSRSSEAAFLLRNEPPAAPSDLTGVVTGDTVDLSWTANTESDLSGYAVKREGETVSPDGRIRAGGDVPTTLTASASSRSSDAGRAIDGNPSTEWESAITSPFTLAWLEVRMSVGRHLREVRILWGFHGARDFRILAEISGRLVPLATVEGNTSDATTHLFPFAVRTARLRVEVTVLEHPGSLRVGIEEVELYGAGPLTVTTASDTPDRSGVYDYEVSALDIFGGVSPLSSVDVVVGDVVPPDPPLDLVANVSLADVNLSWTPSPSPDVSGYRVFREGSSIAVVSGTTHLDAGLPDGIYRYEVSALDFDGNEGAKSNEALAEVSVDSPTAPLLSVSVPPEGKALRLDWTVSSGPLGVAEYAVLRATTSGGPYVEVARSTATSLLDEGLANGVTYFYVTRALDPRGEASPDSNEASGTPSDLAPPEPPVFLKPTTSGVPVTLGTSRTTLVGRSEPGASVAVFRGAEPIGEVAAASSLLETRSLPAGVVDSRWRALSCDRTKLAEIGARETRIWDFVTGELRRLAFDTEGERAHGASFSPKGDRIAVATNSDFGSGSLRILDLETGSVRVLPFSKDVGWPVWRDDDAIAVADRHEIYLVTPSTDTRERLYQALPFDLRPELLLLSPEATRLAFAEFGSLKVLDLETRTV
ncbi:MAG TPA: hypothetical protein VJH87_15390, partial [Vicinamibacteria bacterium]|nr:hypothetical protein [Vicinamibacteria bacterium]